MTILTTMVARTVMRMTGKGHMLFNDRLVDGRRSLKVWGWTDAQYFEAADMLKRMGCVAKVKQFPTQGWHPLGKKFLQVRLYVKEPNNVKS